MWTVLLETLRPLPWWLGLRWSHWGFLRCDCSVYHTETSSVKVHGSVDHTEDSSMNVMVLLIQLWSRQWLLYSADHNWRSLLRLWFWWSYWGFVNGCDRSVDDAEASSMVVGSVDYTEAPYMVAMVPLITLWLYVAVTVLLITLKPPLWLWWFCWSHLSLVYSIVVMVLLITMKPSLVYSMVLLITLKFVYGCDGLVDDIETSSMVVMILLMTLKPRLWLRWFCHTEASSIVVMVLSHWSLVYGCDGSVGSRQQFPSTGPVHKITKGNLFNQK